MKKYYRISLDIDNSPLHLFKSLFLAMYVMGFVNIFIGSMGGISAFAGFFAVFYLLRGMVEAGNRISHQLALESKTEVKYMFANYLLIYSLIWTVIKVLMVLSKITGWGNINGLTINEYITNVYGGTWLEKWPYLFSGILMFSFILSLFPLVFIRKKKHWAAYLVLDSAFFALVCYVISRISKIYVAKELRKRAVCVLDVMVLCKLPKKWEVVLYIVAALVFTVAIGEFVYTISVRFFAPRKGRKVDSSLLQNEIQPIITHARRRILVGAGIVVVAMAVGLGFFFFLPGKKHDKYRKVAECLTEDTTFGPMVYGKCVYIPVDETLNYLDKGKGLGYLAYKDSECDNRFYQLAISNVIYGDKKAKNREFLQLDGAETNSYQKAASVEALENWKKDTVFLLWDEDWSGESTYGKEVTGYSECSAELIWNLEKEFGKVEYRISDFQDYDAYFTIRGYSDMKQVVDSEIPYGDWVGCILVKDNGFYYGNYDNKITGIQLLNLLKVIGGHQ